MNKVTAVANDAGQIVHQSKNPEFGWVRVEQQYSVIEKGFERDKTLSTIINGDIDKLRKKYTHAGIELEGKLVVFESLEPTNPDNLEQDIKFAGKDSGIACSIKGQPIYRVVNHTYDMDAKDVKLEHDNGPSIKAFYAKKKEEEASL